jgi:hypothetical protein
MIQEVDQLPSNDVVLSRPSDLVFKTVAGAPRVSWPLPPQDKAVEVTAATASVLLLQPALVSKLTGRYHHCADCCWSMDTLPLLQYPPPPAPGERYSGHLCHHMVCQLAVVGCKGVCPGAQCLLVHHIHFGE